MIACGLDIGSRTVKSVLYSAEERRVLALRVADATTDVRSDAHALYRKTLEDAAVGRADRVVATGYGRAMVDFAAELTTEITCQAIGVLALVPAAKTVVDIGGQDSKVIHINGGGVRDFTMNDRCAAGTGRFLEVVAHILGADIEALADLALEAGASTEISSMCVVFAESEVLGMLSRGTPREQLAAGIHKAIASRIAGLAERGRFQSPVVFTGGVARNKAMVRALAAELRERLIIPVDPRVTGALGAALLAAGEHGRPRELSQADFLIRINGRKAPANVHAAPVRGGEPCASACGGLSLSPRVPPSSDSPGMACLPTVPSLAHFERMVQNCIDYATKAKRDGRKIVSIFCEFTPREIILAGGAIPVCACGGSHEMALRAESELPANLCPLIKSSYGFFLERANPIFEMSDLVVAETTCDGKKKMYELMGRSKPTHILELTQKPDDNCAFEHWLTEVRLLKSRVEDLTGAKITEERLREAIKLMNRERGLRRRVAELGAVGRLRGSEVLEAKSLISGLPEDFEAYERIIAEAEELPSCGDGKPRILLTGVPQPHGAEKVIGLLEEAGARVVVQENCTGIKPLLEDVSEEGDLLEAIAKKYFHLECSCMMPNTRRFELIDRLVAQFHPEGIVDLVWHACHTYAVESTLLRGHCEDRLLMPFLRLETDYSPSDVSQLRLRVESFLSVVEAKRRNV